MLLENIRAPPLSILIVILVRFECSFRTNDDAPRNGTSKQLSSNTRVFHSKRTMFIEVAQDKMNLVRESQSQDLLQMVKTEDPLADHLHNLGSDRIQTMKRASRA